MGCHFRVKPRSQRRALRLSGPGVCSRRPHQRRPHQRCPHQPADFLLRWLSLPAGFALSFIPQHSLWWILSPLYLGHFSNSSKRGLCFWPWPCPNSLSSIRGIDRYPNIKSGYKHPLMSPISVCKKSSWRMTFSKINLRYTYTTHML